MTTEFFTQRLIESSPFIIIALYVLRIKIIERRKKLTQYQKISRSLTILLLIVIGFILTNLIKSGFDFLAY